MLSIYVIHYMYSKHHMVDSHFKAMMHFIILLDGVCFRSVD